MQDGALVFSDYNDASSALHKVSASTIGVKRSISENVQSAAAEHEVDVIERNTALQSHVQRHDVAGVVGEVIGEILWWEARDEADGESQRGEKNLGHAGTQCHSLQVICQIIRASRAGRSSGCALDAREHVLRGDVAKRLQSGVRVLSWVP